MIINKQIQTYRLLMLHCIVIRGKYKTVNYISNF